MKQAVRKWLPSALLACFWWGLFGFLAKLGSEQANAADMQILFTGGTLPLALALLLRRSRLRSDARGRIIGVATGVFAGLGGVAYFAAMARGKASIVGPVTSLFPLITVMLAGVLLRERLKRIQMLGIGLALISTALLAT